MTVDYSLGLIEVKALGHAILILDDMLKAGDVEFVATERRLGGWLVSLVVKGELTAVKAAVDAGVRRATELNCLKVHEVIARPHTEILKFLHLDEAEEKPVNSESAAVHVGETPAKKPVRRTRRKKAEPKPEVTESEPEVKSEQETTEAKS